MRSKDEIIKCDCMTHGFTVAADEELGVVYLACWSYGQAGSSLSLKDRLLWAWKVLRTGIPFDDEMVLTPEGASTLARTLLLAGKDASKKGTNNA